MNGKLGKYIDSNLVVADTLVAAWAFNHHWWFPGIAFAVFASFLLFTLVTPKD